MPTLGLVPYLADLHIADEDAVALERLTNNQTNQPAVSIDIAIISLPHVANFDEFDALAMEDGVHVRYVRDAQALGRPHAIILPGTKTTIADLIWLRERGLADAIVAVHQAGTMIIGICGGYQMLGQTLADPLGVEGMVGEQCPGLGLLPVQSIFQPHKATNQSAMRLADGMVVRGYEIHSGITTPTATTEPFGEIVERNGVTTQVADGALSADGRVWGCYLHGLFEDDNFRRRWLTELGWQGATQNAAALRQRDYDRLADAVEAAIGWPQIAALCGL